MRIATRFMSAVLVASMISPLAMAKSRPKPNHNSQVQTEVARKRKHAPQTEARKRHNPKIAKRKTRGHNGNMFSEMAKRRKGPKGSLV